MMRYAFLVALVVAAVLAAACEGDESSSRETPSPTGSAAVRPEPAAPIPEGVLLVQRESRQPTTFALEADGEVSEWGHGFSYVASPDGEHAAFLRGESWERPSEVVIVDADGEETFSDEGPEISAAAGVYPSLAWSQDGSRLAYTLQDESRWDRSHVYIVNADGGGLRRMTETPGYHSLLGWAADGRLLVQDSGTLALMGGGKETLPLPEKLRSAYPAFVMSPDGRRVAMSGGNPEEQMELWVMEVDTGESRLVAEMGRLARAPAEERYVSAVPPAAPVEAPAAMMMKGPPPVTWSPDGRRIAYYRNHTDEEGTYFSELRVVDVETGEDVGVTENGAWAASWSPDGRYLAESGGDQGGLIMLGPEGEVRIVDVQTSYILWTRDGRLIAVGGGSVSLVDPGTGRVEEARTADGSAVAGAQGWGTVWSPDGRYVAVATGEDAGLRNGSLYVIDTRTAAATRVLEKGSFLPVAWLAA